MTTYQQIIYGLEGIIVLVLLFSMRETLIEKAYGIRFKRWIEIDTGRRGYTILNKSLNSCKVLGRIRTVNSQNINHGIMYFVTDNVENLKVEDVKEKYIFYCNSEEFDTVYKNKLLETLMLSLQNNWLMIILLAVILGVALNGYMFYLNQETVGKIDWIVWRMNNTYVP